MKLTEAQTQKARRFEAQMVAQPSVFAELNEIDVQIAARVANNRHGRRPDMSSVELTGQPTGDGLESVLQVNGEVGHDILQNTDGLTGRGVSRSASKAELQLYRRENPDLPAVRERLQQLVTEQEAENEHLDAVPFVADWPYAVIDAYQGDPRFRQLVHEFRWHASLLPEFEIPQLRRDVQAKMLELIAHDQELAVHNSPEQGTVVLDSKRSFEFSQMRYPNAPIISEPFGQIGLFGVGVPDYLIVQEGMVMTRVEVTSRPKAEYFDTKIANFVLDDKRGRHSTIFAAANLLFIVPTDFPEKLREAKWDFDDFKSDDPVKIKFASLANVERNEISVLLDALLAAA